MVYPAQPMVNDKTELELKKELALWLEAYVNFAGVFSPEALKSLEKMGPKALLQLIRLGGKNHLLLEHMAKFGKKYQPHAQHIKLQDVSEALNIVKTKAVINS